MGAFDDIKAQVAYFKALQPRPGMGPPPGSSSEFRRAWKEHDQNQSSTRAVSGDSSVHAGGHHTGPAVQPHHTQAHADAINRASHNDRMARESMAKQGGQVPTPSQRAAMNRAATPARNAAETARWNASVAKNKAAGRSGQAGRPGDGHPGQAAVAANRRAVGWESERKGGGIKFREAPDSISQRPPSAKPTQSGPRGGTFKVTASGKKDYSKK